jgi:hypothetical protein
LRSAAGAGAIPPTPFNDLRSMTSTVLCFELIVAGHTLRGFALESESEYDEVLTLLAARGFKIQRAVAAAPMDHPEPHSRGRRSFDGILAAAVSTLETDLADCDSISARARLVLKHLAETHGADNVPSTRTVTAYLADHRVGKKVGNKYGNKSKRARIRRTGGT